MARNDSASVGNHPMAPSSVAVMPSSRISVSTRSTGSCSPHPGTSQMPHEIGPPATRSSSPPSGAVPLSSTYPPPRGTDGVPLPLERSNSYAPPVTLSRVAFLIGALSCAAAPACGDGGEPAGNATVSVAARGCRPTATAAMGVVVGDGLVATVAHAVAGEEEITVHDADGVAHGATVVAIDAGLDAAVLRVDGLGTVTGGTDLPVEVVRSVTIRTTDIYGEGEHLRPGLELAGVVQPGDSGAPVFDDDGRLVGLVWARSRERDDRAWALTIDAIAPLVDAARRGDPVAPVRCAR